MPRGVNQLTRPEAAAEIKAALGHYQAVGKWWIHLLVLMPDHLHGLISFARDSAMNRSVSDWKRYLARKAGIEWQRDFFDHRIRNESSLEEKGYYIRQNPVRKGLVPIPEAWPYQWTHSHLTNPPASPDPTTGRDGSPSRPPAFPNPAVSEKPPYPGPSPISL